MSAERVPLTEAEYAAAEQSAFERGANSVTDLTCGVPTFPCANIETGEVVMLDARTWRAHAGKYERLNPPPKPAA